jgi:hypothetical protein
VRPYNFAEAVKLRTRPVDLRTRARATWRSKRPAMLSKSSLSLGLFWGAARELLGLFAPEGDAAVGEQPRAVDKRWGQAVRSRILDKIVL